MEELVLEKGIPSLVVPTTSTIIQNKMATWDDFLYISKHGDPDKKWMIIESGDSIKFSTPMYFMQTEWDQLVLPIVVHPCTDDSAIPPLTNEHGGIAWNKAIVFVEGDIVTRDNRVYIAIKSSINEDPLTSPGIWMEFDATEIGGIAWEQFRQYSQGDVISERQSSPGSWRVWVCIRSHTSGMGFGSNINDWKMVNYEDAVLMRGWFNPNVDGGGLPDHVVDGSLDYQSDYYLITEIDGTYDTASGTTGSGTLYKRNDVLKYNGSKWEHYPNQIGADLLLGWFNPNVDGGGGLHPIENGSSNFEEGQYYISQFNGWYNFNNGTTQPIGSGEEIKIGDRIRYNTALNIWELLEDNKTVFMTGWFDPTVAGGGLNDPIEDGSAKYTDEQYVIASGAGQYDFSIGAPGAGGVLIAPGDRIVYYAGSWYVFGESNSKNKGWFMPNIDGGGPGAPYDVVDGTAQYENGDYLISTGTGNYDFSTGLEDPAGDIVRKGDRVIYLGSRWVVVSASLGLMKGWFNPTQPGGFGTVPFPIIDGTGDYMPFEYIISEEDGRYDFGGGAPDAIDGTVIRIGDRIRFDGLNWTKLEHRTERSLTEVITQTGHGFAPLDAIRYDDALGQWVKALATATTTLQHAVVGSVLNADEFIVFYAGVVNVPAHGYSMNETYYLDDTTHGRVVLKQTEYGKINKPVFHVVDADTVLVSNDEYTINGDGGALVIGVNQAAHGFNVAEPITQDDAGVWRLAQADSADNLATGVVVNVIDADNFEVQTGGFFELNPSPFNANEVFYLDQATAGNITNVMPATGLVQAVLKGAGNGDKVLIYDMSHFDATSTTSGIREYTAGDNYATDEIITQRGTLYKVLTDITNAPTYPEYDWIQPLNLGAGKAFYREYQTDLADPTWLKICTIPSYGAYNVNIGGLFNGKQAQISGSITANYKTANISIILSEHSANTINEIRLFQDGDGNPWELWIAVATSTAGWQMHFRADGAGDGLMAIDSLPHSQNAAPPTPTTIYKLVPGRQNMIWDTHPSYLENLGNVEISSPQDGDALLYEASSSRWKNQAGGVGSSGEVFAWKIPSVDLGSGAHVKVGQFSCPSSLAGKTCNVVAHIFASTSSGDAIQSWGWLKINGTNHSAKYVGKVRDNRASAVLSWWVTMPSSGSTIELWIRPDGETMIIQQDGDDHKSLLTMIPATHV